MTATGTATLAGGTVQASPAAGTYDPRTRYAILTAAGGVTGQFAGVTSVSTSSVVPVKNYAVGIADKAGTSDAPVVRTARSLVRDGFTEARDLADLAGAIRPAVFFGAVALTGAGNGIVLPSANAGMMSVRPELAGTASGLGGAMAVAGGAALAALAPEMMISAGVNRMDDLTGLNPAQILAWTGTREERPRLWRALRDRGVEVQFGTLGPDGTRRDDRYAADGDVSEYRDLVRQGVTVIATDTPLAVAGALGPELAAAARCPR